jgi:hypothetical protein
MQGFAQRLTRRENSTAHHRRGVQIFLGLSVLAVPGLATPTARLMNASGTQTQFNQRPP